MSWYPVQNTNDFIGTKASPSTLTTSYGDNTKTFETGGMVQVVLYIQYVANAGTNVLAVKIDRSPDRVDNYQQITELYDAGTATISLAAHNFTSSSGTTYKLSLPVQIAGSYTRASVLETVNSGTAGTIWIQAEISGK